MRMRPSIGVTGPEETPEAALVADLNSTMWLDKTAAHHFPISPI